MKRNKLLLVSWIIGLAYVFYLISYFVNGVASTSGTEQIGAGLAATIVMPHMIVVLIAVIFNIFGWLKNTKGFVLTGAILYAVSIVLFPPYFMFVLLEMILSFIGYSSVKKEINLSIETV